MFGRWRDTQDVRKATIRNGRTNFEISAAAEPFRWNARPQKNPC
jgi:hypothetical protein